MNNDAKIMKRHIRCNKCGRKYREIQDFFASTDYRDTLRRRTKAARLMKKRGRCSSRVSASPNKPFCYKVFCLYNAALHRLAIMYSVVPPSRRDQPAVTAVSLSVCPACLLSSLRVRTWVPSPIPGGHRCRPSCPATIRRWTASGDRRHIPSRTRACAP